MEGDFGGRYMFQKLNDFRGGKSGDQAMKYMSEKVKEIKGMEGETILQYLKELLHKLVEILPPQIKNATLRDWIIWVSIALAVPLFIYLCFCCIFPMLLYMLKALALLVFRFFYCLWQILYKMTMALVSFVRSCFCCCGRSASRMMKAPGRSMRIPRVPFESNPAAYFRGLRAGAPLGPQFVPYKSLV